LRALRDRVLGPDAETIVIGDTESDLPISGRPRVGLHPPRVPVGESAISRYRYQRGLLDIVSTLVDRETNRCDDRVERADESDGERLFLDLLRVADHFRARELARALFDRATFRIFVR